MARLFVSGNTTYISTATAPVSSTPLTLACWFLPVADVFNAIVGIGAAGSNDNRYTLNIQNTASGNHLTAQARTSVNAIATTTNTVARTGIWQHGAAVFAGQTSRSAYLNGAGKGTDASNVGPNTPNAVYIGDNMGLGTSGFDGRIAEVGVWNVALTDAEIAALAAGASPLRIRPQNLVEYWPLYGANSPEPSYGTGHSPGTLSGTAPTLVAHAPVMAPFGLRGGRAPYVVAAPPPSIARFRRTLSVVGARSGSRQAI